jgi:hypothetical protein
MSPKYWTGVLIGMLAIFGVGMLVARGIDRGKALFTRKYPAALTLLNEGMRVDGHRVGEIQRVQFLRSEPGRVDSTLLTVNSGESGDTVLLAHCALWISNHDQVFGSGTRFYCASHADSASMQLVPFGHVLVLPDSHEVALYVPEEMAERAHEHAYRGAGGDTGDVDIQHDNGTFSLSVNHRELVHISGGDSGGSVVIRTSSGKPLIDIHGDSNGGSIKITDTNGKTRVDVHGTSSDSHE